MRYIEVTLADIATANRLAHDVLGRSLDALPPQTRKLLTTLHAWVAGECQRQAIGRCDLRFTRRQVRDVTGWGNTQLKVHLGRLADLEYVLTHRGLRGGGFEYELIYDAQGEAGGRFLMGLAELQTIADDYDGKRSGAKEVQSAPGRGAVGGVSAGGRGDLIGLKAGTGAGLEAIDKADAPEAPLELRTAVPTYPQPSFLAAGRRRCAPALESEPEPVAKKGTHTPRAPIGDVRDPDSLYHYLQRFNAWQAERNYSPKTILGREDTLRYFIAWLDERGVRRPARGDQADHRALPEPHVRLPQEGRSAALARTQHGRITPIRAWFKWLAKQNFILYNPASDLDLPRLDRRLPRHVLSVREAEAVLAVPDLGTATGIRDRAMMEVLYSTGMRRMELAHLKLFDIDHERSTVMIRQGKGKKDRMVPIGERALAWVEKYRDDVRPELATGADDGTLFLTHLGEAFSPNRLTQLVRDHVQAAGTGKTGSCHLFRHTMATLMLENGADIRYIQAMLGHAELSTTQVYTQVSIRQLKAIHTATHPGRLPGAGAAKTAGDNPTPQHGPLNAAVALLGHAGGRGRRGRRRSRRQRRGRRVDPTALSAQLARGPLRHGTAAAKEPPSRETKLGRFRARARAAKLASASRDIYTRTDVEA